MALESVEMPPRAPRAAVAQDVGLTHISVEYRSPAIRGRQLWGAHVAYGEPWRAGDSPQATIGFSRDVTIGEKVISAGTYSLVATPGPESWTFSLERLEVPAERGHEPSAVRVDVPVERGETRERLRFTFSSFTTSSARLDLEWERVRVSLPITVDTNGQILAAIGELDRRDADLGRDYAQAAAFLLSKKGSEADREKGRAYLQRAAALGANLGDTSARTTTASEPSDPPRIGAFGPVSAPVPSAIASGILPAPSERSAPSRERATHAPGADEIGPVVSRGQPAIQACYQRALRRDPTLAGGKITVAIVVGTSGRVKSVDVQAPEALRRVEECVKAAVALWAFPPSPETYATELPLVLDRRD
jgi:hypothetical protein